MEIRQAYNFILAVYFESKSDRVLIYVILLSSDCFKVQGHLVPRLNTYLNNLNFSSFSFQIIAFSGAKFEMKFNCLILEQSSG